jgi:protein phosphatase
MSEGPRTTSFSFDAGATSIVGTVRDHNEDAACALPEIGLVAVADGLGGHNAGERASGLAIEVLEQHLRADHEAGAEPNLEALFAAFEDANARILADAVEHPDRAGMGTTLTSVLIADDRVLVAHIGDSRAWRVRDGVITQLTRDHTVVGQQVRDGILTEEQAENHPMKHVLSRCLGAQPTIEVDLAEGDVAIDDIYVLASDGLVHGLDADAIAKIVIDSVPAEDSSASLVKAACAIDGQDNITAAVLICRDS